MYSLYRALTVCFAPFLPLLLRLRLAKGKEDASRMNERLGHAVRVRPTDKILWVHASSMGESASALPLIEAFLKQRPNWQVLVTSVTLTSARMLAEKLPTGALHQFAPLDEPTAIARFLERWQPDAALWVESELWPNMAIMTAATGCPMFLANARLSERSFKRWKLAKPLFLQIMACFKGIYPQSAVDAERFAALGAENSEMLGNLKYDVPALTADTTALKALTATIGKRPVWLAASTHAGEEAQILAAHRILKGLIPDILTIIVPRHAVRGAEVAAIIRAEGCQTAIRSAYETILPQTEVYLADTMGELGLFYRLCPVAFIGGSLVPHGGQNVLEAAKLGCAIIIGMHTHNFAVICQEFVEAQACYQIENAALLAEKVGMLLSNATTRKNLTDAAAKVVARHGGVMAQLLTKLEGV